MRRHEPIIHSTKRRHSTAICTAAFSAIPLLAGASCAAPPPDVYHTVRIETMEQHSKAAAKSAEESAEESKSAQEHIDHLVQKIDGARLQAVTLSQQCAATAKEKAEVPRHVRQ